MLETNQRLLSPQKAPKPEIPNMKLSVLNVPCQGFQITKGVIIRKQGTIILIYLL